MEYLSRMQRFTRLARESAERARALSVEGRALEAREAAEAALDFDAAARALSERNVEIDALKGF
jgi:predicted ATPase